MAADQADIRQFAAVFSSSLDMHRANKDAGRKSRKRKTRPEIVGFVAATRKICSTDAN